jgi:hypothetical protein
MIIAKHKTTSEDRHKENRAENGFLDSNNFILAVLDFFLAGKRFTFEKIKRC